MLNPTLPITFSPLHRLQYEESQQQWVILYPEGMVELNLPAAEILKLCDGTRVLAQVVAELESKFETTELTDDVRNFLEHALGNGWIQQGGNH